MYYTGLRLENDTLSQNSLQASKLKDSVCSLIERREEPWVA